MPEIANVVTGETIESEWGNAIRDRTVQRYATVTERSSLHPSPTEGDMAWMEDSNTLLVYNGTAWVPFTFPAQGFDMGHGFNVAGGPAITTSFVDQASVSFAMPAGWSTARVLAWGSVVLFDAVGLTGQYNNRIEIGANNGAEGQITKGSTTDNDSITLVSSHRADVSGTSLIAIAASRTGGGTGTVLYMAYVAYIAARLT